MEYIVWRLGESAVRSKPSDRPNKDIDHSQNAVNAALENEQSQYQGLDMIDLSLRQAETMQTSNMRENVNSKLSEREMVGQVGQNPFFTQNTYSIDLDIQEAFLRPKSSHEASKDE